MLSSHLAAALDSRSRRQIRRTLPIEAQSRLIDFTSNDYLSLSSSPILRQRFLSKIQDSDSTISSEKQPQILGSGGSRLLVYSPAHAFLEDRLADFFKAPSALLFNSGFDANVGVFSSIPQPGDAVIYDEYIHASVYDGMRSSRVRTSQTHSFSHNSLDDFQKVLRGVVHSASGQAYVSGKHSIFVAVESLYSMDGTFAPLEDMIGILEEMFPKGNAYLIVDEAHATGIYGPEGRGMVAQLGLENKVLVRLHTFGKALAATGAVILTSDLIKQYLINFARSLIYTTATSPINVIAAGCSFDLLEDGTARELSLTLLSLSDYFISTLQQRLLTYKIPPKLISLPSHLRGLNPTNTPPTPIIPLLTPIPRSLSSRLLEKSINARPITWPTVPKGKDRVRVCLHSGNTREEVDRLIEEIVVWAKEVMREERRKVGKRAIGGFIESKL